MARAATRFNLDASTDITRLAGWLCFWAGLLGAASGVFLAVVPPAVTADRFSYPLTPAAFALIQVWFVVQHLGLIAGVEGLRRSGALGTARSGVVLAFAGLGLLTLMEVLAIGAAGSTYPGPGTALLDAGYGIASVVSGLGLFAGGVAVLRSRSWGSWHRWLPLMLGA